MKKLTPFLLTAALLSSSVASADVVVGEEADSAVGKTAGAWAGILLGGAAGGPVGAVLGGVVGLFGGGEAQESTGLAGTAYRVQREDGSEIVVRSPNRRWNDGDQVAIRGNRLVSANVDTVAVNDR